MVMRTEHFVVRPAEYSVTAPEKMIDGLLEKTFCLEYSCGIVLKD